MNWSCLLQAPSRITISTGDSPTIHESGRISCWTLLIDTVRFSACHEQVKLQQLMSLSVGHHIQRVLPRSLRRLIWICYYTLSDDRYA